MVDNQMHRSPQRKRLHSEFDALNDLTANSEFIRFESLDSSVPPSVYMVHFTCRGIAAVNNQGIPEYSDLHRVRITLSAEYPLTRPYLQWLTPIFHPNISESGSVCIEWLPSQDLAELCITLGHMVQYISYNASSPLRIDAAQWAMENSYLLPVDDRPLRRDKPNIATDATRKIFEVRFLNDTDE